MSRICLTADEGKIYTDGETYASIVWLAEGISQNSFYQIPYEEYEKILALENEELNNA